MQSKPCNANCGRMAVIDMHTPASEPHPVSIVLCRECLEYAASCGIQLAKNAIEKLDKEAQHG